MSDRYDAGSAFDSAAGRRATSQGDELQGCSIYDNLITPVDNDINSTVSKLLFKLVLFFDSVKFTLAR